MTTRIALRMLVILGWAGLVVELANSNPWAVTIAGTVALIWLSTRIR